MHFTDCDVIIELCGLSEPVCIVFSEQQLKKYNPNGLNKLKVNRFVLFTITSVQVNFIIKMNFSNNLHIIWLGS